MATRDAKIDSNDSYQDVYRRFFELYNDGMGLLKISTQIVSDYEEMFHDMETRYDALFALAMAQWETKSSNPVVMAEVREIIESGAQLELWKSLGADDELLKERQKELENFLRTISEVRESPRPRVKPRDELYDEQLLKLFSPDELHFILITDHHVNGVYQYTIGIICWATGGSSVFRYIGKGKYIAVEWFDADVLVVHHDPSIVFSRKEERVHGLIVYYISE